MNDDADRQKKAAKINSKLDEVASKASGPDAAYGSIPGYVQENTEDDAQMVADKEGVALYRNTDGSHEAIDESKMAPGSDTDD